MASLLIPTPVDHHSIRITSGLFRRVRAILLLPSPSPSPPSKIVAITIIITANHFGQKTIIIIIQPPLTVLFRPSLSLKSGFVRCRDLTATRRKLVIRFRRMTTTEMTLRDATAASSIILTSRAHLRRHLGWRRRGGGREQKSVFSF